VHNYIEKKNLKGLGLPTKKLQAQLHLPVIYSELNLFTDKRHGVHWLFIVQWSRHNRGHAIFLSRQPLFILHSKLYSKYQDHSKTLKHLPIEIWSSTLVSKEYFCMVNPCCDFTKTTVEIKNLSKMADISLLQVKIFQELSKI
jgi:hypothetical protein